MTRTLLLLVMGALSCPHIAAAQLRGTGLVAPDALARGGLERMWFTQLSLDRGRGRAAGLFMHVSPTQSHTVFQVSHDGKRYVFSERDRDAFKTEIGVDVAREMATKKAEELNKLDQAMGKASAAPPAVETHVVPKITLYASSERGLIHALDGETGRTLWTTQVGNPLYPTTTPAANDNFVGVANGSTTYVLKADDGSVAWSRPAMGIPGAGPALTDDLIFVPMVSGHIESLFLAEPKRPVSIFKSYGRAMVQPVISSNSVAWATDSGNLYVGLAHGPGVRFRMQATDAIASAPAFLAPDLVFVTSLDGYIYCLNEQKGNILWRFTTGEPITHSPVPFDDTVYAITKRGNMFAIDASTAAERWVTSGIRSYVAGNAKRLYCFDAQGDLAILDRTTGSRLGTVAVPASDVPFMNVQTDRIILISSTGLVQSLREADLPFPVVHFLIEPRTKPTRPTPKTEAPKADEPRAQPIQSDPFGPGTDRPATPATPAVGDPFADPVPARPTAPPAGDPFAMP